MSDGQFAPPIIIALHGEMEMESKIEHRFPFLQRLRRRNIHTSLVVLATSSTCIAYW